MIVTKSEELDGLKACGRAVARTIREMAAILEPGMTARELDDIGRAILAQEGAQSAPQLVYDFPGATCISIEPVIAHGWADEQMMKAGDLVNIDVSAEKDGYFTDAGATFLLPPAKPEKLALIKATRQARDRAIAQLRPGQAMQSIPQTFMREAQAGGYTIVENLLGCHGVGKTLHDKPEILSVPNRGDRRLLKEGMVLAVEPFFSTGANFAEDGDRQWELFTPGSLTVQFEHSVVISKNGPIILTA